MSTARLLEAMTDEGEFELLAAAIFTKSNEAYSTIIHFGVNAEGKTVPYAVDDFCRVPFALFCHLLHLKREMAS